MDIEKVIEYVKEAFGYSFAIMESAEQTEKLQEAEQAQDIAIKAIQFMDRELNHGAVKPM